LLTVTSLERLSAPWKIESGRAISCSSVADDDRLPHETALFDKTQ
jgi:hypothetical protein